MPRRLNAPDLDKLGPYHAIPNLFPIYRWVKRGQEMLLGEHDTKRLHVPLFLDKHTIGINYPWPECEVPGTNVAGGFDKAPRELLDRILSHVDPIDSLHLGRTNTSLNEFLNSEDALHCWIQAGQPLPAESITLAVAQGKAIGLSQMDIMQAIFTWQCLLCGSSSDVRFLQRVHIQICQACEHKHMHCLTRLDLGRALIDPPFIENPDYVYEGEYKWSEETGAELGEVNNTIGPSDWLIDSQGRCCTLISDCLFRKIRTLSVELVEILGILWMVTSRWAIDYEWPAFDAFNATLREIGLSQKQPNARTLKSDYCSRCTLLYCRRADGTVLLETRRCEKCSGHQVDPCYIMRAPQMTFRELWSPKPNLGRTVRGGRMDLNDPKAASEALRWPGPDFSTFYGYRPSTKREE